MRKNEIKSAYLIRALARGEAEHCDACDARMFVKHASGLCPFCLNDRPQLRNPQPQPFSAANEPFLPRLEIRPVKLRTSWRTVLRRAFGSEQTLRPGRASDVPLAHIRNSSPRPS